MLKNLYTQVDFLNLTRADTMEITKLLDIDIPEDSDKYQFLYDNINLIEDNKEANKILNKKILAGQVSIKWYKYEYDDNFTKEALKMKLESKKFGYNIDAKEKIQSTEKDNILSIVNDREIYTIKMFIFDGYQRYNNGIEYKKEEIMKSIIVKININDCWVEIRANDERCAKTEKILEAKLGLDLKSVRILNKYKNEPSIFKNDLIDGFYLNYKAAPSESIKLTIEDGKMIANIIDIIDDYLINKNGENVLNSLEKLNFDTEGLSFSSLLLAGIDNLGMKMKNDSDKDMSKQTLYTILKDHFIEDSSYIKFKNIKDGDEFTMRLGLKTNSIAFKSSVTEDVITYIREKIL